MRIAALKHGVVSICSLSTAEYCETALPILRLGTGTDTGPGAICATGLSAALPHVGLAHVNPDRVANDPAHDCVGMNLAAEPLLEFCDVGHVSPSRFSKACQSCICESTC